jgi:hypothetical protein
MCTRYIPPSQAELESAWHIGRHNQPRWAHEVFPRALGPFLRLGAGGGLDLVVGSWGLIPAWSKTSLFCRVRDVLTFKDEMPQVTFASLERFG